MHEELCPECGHLLTKWRKNCAFCGWKSDSRMEKAGFDPEMIQERRGIYSIPDKNSDLLIEKLDRDTSENRQ